MRAVLFLDDMPSSCFDCPLFRESIVDTCFPLDRCIHDEEGGFDEDGGRPLWCPLRPLPKEIEDGNYNDYQFGFQQGFNECLEMIKGETE